MTPALRAARAIVAASLAAVATALAAVPVAVADEKPTLAEMEAVRSSGRVVIKFAEGSGVRIAGGRITGLPSDQAAALAATLKALGISPAAIRRLHAGTEGELATERAAAERESGEVLPDLNLYFTVAAPSGTTPAVVADRLNRLPFVEFAEPQAAPSPPPGLPPSFVEHQGYRVAPGGVGVLDPRTDPGGNGRGITVADVEYSWQLDHQDLQLPKKPTILGNSTIDDPFDDTNHGTAVLGELYARNNGYGVTGLVPQATVRVSPVNTVEDGFSVARAIGVASRALGRGDVILIEQQAAVCDIGQCTTGKGCGPVEWNRAEFDAIKVATARGIVVVEAAGNGDVDLDSRICKGRFDRSKRDSGAIIVGAGSPTDRSRMWFSSYGSRVDVQGWGDGVWTTGYGDAFNGGSAKSLYTAEFSGTSSASPIVTGVVVAVQGALAAARLPRATPAEVRRALVQTGLPQKGEKKAIGPLPQTAKALALLKRWAHARKTAPTAGTEAAGAGAAGALVAAE